MKNQRFVVDLMNLSGAFERVFCANEYVFVANQIDHLTCFCSPKVTRRQGSSRVTYDLLIAVTDGDRNPETFMRRINARETVGLPRPTPSRNTLDTFVHDGRISEWLVGLMVADMQKYTLSCRDALSLVASTNEKFFENLRSVLPRQFEDRILKPLAELC
jgi:hypothetical protein